MATLAVVIQSGLGLYAEGLGCGNDKNFRTLRSAMDGSEGRTWSSYLARTDSRSSYGVGSEGLGFKASASGPRESAKPVKPSKPVSAKTWDKLSKVGFALGITSVIISFPLSLIFASTGQGSWGFLPFGLGYVFLILGSIAEYKAGKASISESIKEYHDSLGSEQKR